MTDDLDITARAHIDRPRKENAEFRLTFESILEFTGQPGNQGNIIRMVRQTMGASNG